MKSVLISIQPQGCELIASGEQTIIVKKTKPKLPTPFKCYIYCTKAVHPVRDNGCVIYYEDDLAITNRFGRGKLVENPYGFLGEREELLNGRVVGEFMCDKIDVIECSSYAHKEYSQESCLTQDDFIKYCNGQDLYGWHITNLVIYDEPKELSEFWRFCGEKPKCGGCPAFYVESSENGYYEECSSVNEYCRPLTRPPQSWCYVEGNII